MIWKDMLKECVERYCVLANKKVEQLYTSFKPLPGWSSSQAGRTRRSWRIVTSLLTHCRKMLVLGTNWTIWYLVVSQQACEISHKMDSGMWQTLGKADFLHSSHKRFPTVLSCGKHFTALQTGFASRLRLCWRSWGLKINLGAGVLCIFGSRHLSPLSYVFRKSNICPSELDVQETKLLSRTAPQGLRSFLWMLDYVWMGYLLSNFGTWWLNCHVQLTTRFNQNIQATRKLRQFLIPKPRPNMSKEDKRLSSWVKWITYLPTHILLKENLSCTSLKTTKPWSKW